MMTVSELSVGVGLLSTLTMWCALALRAVPALRRAHQRGLWLSVMAAAIAITLFQPTEFRWLRLLGLDVPMATLLRNVIGVLSAGLVLLFMIDPARARRLYVSVVVALVGAIGSLLILNVLQIDGDAPESTTSLLRPADPAFLYMMILIAAHIAGDAVALVVCWRFSLRADDRDLVWSLRLFAGGSVLAVVFWSGYLWQLLGRAPYLLPYLSVVIGVHGLLRAASLLVPTVSTLARTAAVLRTTWKLWPLWRDLVTAVPQVALTPPQRSRLEAMLRRRSPLALQAHRQLIETYDALLDLQRYVQPDAYQTAQQQAQDAGVPHDRLTASALAGALGQARHAKILGVPPSSVVPLPGIVHGSPEMLLSIAREWPSMANALPHRPHCAPHGVVSD